MKKRYIVIIIIIAVIAASYAYARYWAQNLYESIDVGNVPAPSVDVAGQTLTPIHANVWITVFTEGSLYENPDFASVISMLLGISPVKSLDCIRTETEWQVIPGGTVFDMADPASWLGDLGEAPYTLEITLPDTMKWSISLAQHEPGTDNPPFYTRGSLGSGRDTGAAADGAGSVTEKIIIKQTGEYVIDIKGTLEENEISGISGIFSYRAYFSIVNPPMIFAEGRTELEQGDILSLKLENVPEGVVPEIESELGPAIFTIGVPRAEDDSEELPKLDGLTDWFGIVPVSNSRDPGKYPVIVRAGDRVYEIAVTVSEYDFDFQNMIIDTSIPSVAAATTTQAIDEFREKVAPLIPLMTEERFWDGFFIMPVDLGPAGFVSTEFGEIRITNGNQNTRRSHLGMDFAVKTGTPVHASNAGKVLLAEFLLNTGNTVIIDHGGGLKSFYYHMDSVEDLAGTIIERGTLIGTVGSTGYSTGPHLHFEMRIGEQPISPSMLFDPGAGLYSLK